MYRSRGGCPTPQGTGDWQNAPPAPTPPSAPAHAPGGFQTAPVRRRTGPGGVLRRPGHPDHRLLIDAILLSVLFWVIGIAILGGLLLTGGIAGAIIGFLCWASCTWAGSAIYFIYTWTTMRASPGQKILNLETVNAADGATLTRDQAIRRWAYLFGPSAVGTVANFALAGTDIGFLGSLISLATFVYTLYLLWSASQSPKRQGFHDVQSGTVVVKRG